MTGRSWRRQPVSGATGSSTHCLLPGRSPSPPSSPAALPLPDGSPGGPTHSDAPSATTSTSWSVVAAGSPHLAPRPTTTILATSHPTVHPLDGPVDPTTHPDLTVQVPQGDPTRVLDMAAPTPTNAPMPTASSSAIIPPTPGETSDFDSLLL
jgi:hypothetical protein